MSKCQLHESVLVMVTQYITFLGTDGSIDCMIGGNQYERIFFIKRMCIEYSSWNIRVRGRPQICIDLILISSIRSMTFLSMKSSDLMCIWLTIIFRKIYRHVHHHLTFVTSSAVEDRTTNLFTSARHFKKHKLHKSRWKQSSNDFFN